MTNSTVCPVCSKPLAGCGKCKSYTHVAIGPRKVGQVWGRRYEAATYTVLAIDAEGTTVPSWMGWGITVQHSTHTDPVTHCTAFDAKRDVLVAEVAA